VGTYCYAAPEIFRNSTLDCQKVDIFALGVTLFNLVTSTYGFDEAKISDKLYKLIAIRKYPEYWEKTSTIIKNTISEEFKNLYLKMVAYRVSERPSIKEILEDEWMKEINEKNEKEIKELELEIYKEFCDREEIIKNLTEKNVTKPNNGKYDNNIKGENRNTSEGGKDDFEEILPKTFRKGKYLENFNVINGDLEPVIFMNDLTKNLRKGNNMKEKDYDCKSIVASKYKLKFRATFEKVANVESSEEIDEDIKKEFEKISPEGINQDEIKERLEHFIEIRIKISKMCTPILLKRSIEIIKKYIDDEIKSGAMPLSRNRIEEIKYILEELKNLEIFPDSEINESKEINNFTEAIAKSKKGHLFVLHNILSEFITTKENDIKILVKDIFKIISHEMGYDYE
jgi:serine/threonine protein kinase